MSNWAYVELQFHFRSPVRGGTRHAWNLTESPQMSGNGFLFMLDENFVLIGSARPSRACMVCILSLFYAEPSSSRDCSRICKQMNARIKKELLFCQFIPSQNALLNWNRMQACDWPVPISQFVPISQILQRRSGSTHVNVYTQHTLLLNHASMASASMIMINGSQYIYRQIHSTTMQHWHLHLFIFIFFIIF